MLQQDEKPVSTLILDIEYPEIAGWRGIDENKHVPNVGRVGRPTNPTQRRSDGNAVNGDQNQVAGWEDYQHSQHQAPSLGRGNFRGKDTEPNLAGWQDYNSMSNQEVVPHVRDPRGPPIPQREPQNINRLGSPQPRWSEAIADAENSQPNLCDSEPCLESHDSTPSGGLQRHNSHHHRHHRHRHHMSQKKKAEEEEKKRIAERLKVSNTFKLIRALGAWEKKVKPPWQRILLLPTGTMPVWSNYIKKYPLFDFIDYILRGLGGAAFSNNPITGICVLLTLMVGDQWKAVCAVIGVLSSTLCALGLGFNRTAIRSGLFGYNGVLAALALATFHTGGDWDWKLIPFLVFVTLLTTPVLQVLAKVMIPTWSITPLGFPSLLPVLFYLAGTPLYSRIDPHNSLLADGSDEEPFTFITFVTAWFSGVAGTLFLTKAAMLSPILIVGVAIFSPIIAAAYIIGAGVGTLYAWGVGISLFEIKLGLWGVNGALAACYMATFYVVTVRGIVALVACSLVGTFLHAGFITFLQPATVPALGLGANLAALMFLLMQGLVFRLFPVAPVDVTTPEDHLHRLHTLQKLVARWIAIWRSHKQERKLDRLKENVIDDKDDDDDLEWGSAKGSKDNSRTNSYVGGTSAAPNKTPSNSMIKYRPSSGPITQITPATPKSPPANQPPKQSSFQPVKSLKAIFKKISGRENDEERESLLKTNSTSINTQPRFIPSSSDLESEPRSPTRQLKSTPAPKPPPPVGKDSGLKPAEVKRTKSESHLITSHDDVEVTIPLGASSSSQKQDTKISTSFSMLPKFPEEIEAVDHSKGKEPESQQQPAKGRKSPESSSQSLPETTKTSTAATSSRGSSRNNSANNSANPSPSGSLTRFDDSLLGFASPARTEDDIL